MNTQWKVRKRDDVINLVDVSKEKWSYGGGIAQYVTGRAGASKTRVTVLMTRAGRGGSHDRQADDSLVCVVLATCERGGRRTMPTPMGLIFAATAILVSPVFVSPVLAATCPAPLAQAKRLVLVATQSMVTALATLQRFRPRSADLPWKRVSAAEPAVVGQAGLGLGYPLIR